ncbi:unnamed protein product [Lepeophtheirus salmonis]|uniref:(salmon louse) hypothetical protein n=1 Tax=Lepeophtheirus salmonis TaxID=72036 RepID=A0A7R8CVI0_LEPSM|nr:unnamed protein product [Lepeophtheirus salmonis]CAF2894406.1 unnamed protein product [Lepeophtheirus salmonis]
MLVLPRLWGSCADNCTVEFTKPPETCKTVSGANCTFPFKYNNVEYDKCTNVGDTKSWCGISLYNDTNEVDTWGYCNSACEPGPTPDPTRCLTVEGQECIFPFQYYETLFEECSTSDNSGRPWCATTVGTNNEAIGWGICALIVWPANNVYSAIDDGLF